MPVRAEVRSERILGRPRRAQLVLLGERQLCDLAEPDRRVVPGELLAVELGALEQVGELLPEARVVDGELLGPGA